jgi:hypothetical protein
MKRHDKCAPQTPMWISWSNWLPSSLKIHLIIMPLAPCLYNTPSIRWYILDLRAMRSISTLSFGWGATAGGAEARRRVVHVAPSRRLHRGQVKDGRVNATGCVGPCYPYFAIFFLLGPRGIVIFSLLLGPINKTLKGWGYLPLLTFSFPFPSCREWAKNTISFPTIRWGREGGRGVTSVVWL